MWWVFIPNFLLEIADQRPNNVSGGEAQRASIARAVDTKTEPVFSDEPTAALDSLLTKEVLDSVKFLNEGYV